MPIPFDRLGVWFRLFSARLYPGRAKRDVFTFIRAAEPGRPVVDLGGGTGALLDLAHSKRTDLAYLCADPALGMLRYVRPYAGRVAARAEDLPFRDKAVGAVMIGDAIHHFADIERAMEEVRRTLKPGGRLLVLDMNPKTLMGRIAVALERLLGEPANFCTPEGLQELLGRRGFAVSVKGRGWLYTVEAEKRPIGVAPTGI